MPSDKLLSVLPEINKLKQLTQSIAMLDAILCHEPELRYYHFNSQWDKDQMLASMDSGSGNTYYLIFNKDGAFLKGFDHESEMSPYNRDEEEVWPGVFDSVPENFKVHLSEPAFSIEDTTFCIWRTSNQDKWACGKIDYPNSNPEIDGSSWMLALLTGDSLNYCKWAKSYYESKIDPTIVQEIYNFKPLTNEMVLILNPLASIDFIRTEAVEIGYPVSN